MNLDEFRKEEEKDSNLFQRLSFGEIQNLFEEAVELIEDFKAENKYLKIQLKKRGK